MITFNTEQVTKNTTSKDLEALNAGCPEVKLQEKSVEYTQNAEYVVSPDAGYDGLSKVNVSVDLVVPTVQNSKTVNITKNGSTTVKPDTDYDAVEQVVVNTNIPLQEKQVNVLLSEPTTVILPDTGYTGITKLTVNHPPVEANTAYTANENGSYTIHPSEGFEATTSVNLTVNVPATPVEPTKSVEITQNGTTNIIPADGYNAIEGVDVTVNVPSKEEETKSVSYTSNGSYTVQPTEGKTLSEVSVSVNVPSSGALDVSSPYVCFALLGETRYDSSQGGVTLDDINGISGWENLTDGFYKFNNTYIASPLIWPENLFQNLISGNSMFSSARARTTDRQGGVLNMSNQSFPNLETAEQMFSLTSTATELQMPSEDVAMFPKLKQALRMFAGARILSGGYVNVTGPLESITFMFSGSFPDSNHTPTVSLTNLSNLTDADRPLGVSNSFIEEFILTGLPVDCNLSVGTHLSEHSVSSIITTLADVTSNPKTLTLSTQVQSYVTEDMKTAATAKGWTINFA